MNTIIDLSKEHEKLFLTCLTGDKQRFTDSGPHKMCWYKTMQSRGCRVKLVLDKQGNPGGMIQYLPVEESNAEGNNLLFMQCIWVLNDKKGRGNFRKKGMGKALLKAFESDAIKQGKDGVAVWGLTIPVFMPASWFKKNGYSIADKKGIQVLLWKKFKDNAVKPRWMTQKKTPVLSPDKVTVCYFKNGWCPEVNKTLQRTERVIDKFQDDVVFTIIDTSEKKALREWGITDALFINDKEIPLGPAPKEKKIYKAIKKAVKHLHKKRNHR